MKLMIKAHVAAAVLGVSAAASATPVESLAERLLGEKSSAFRFESAPAAAYFAEEGRIVIAGPSDGDQALALGAYLRDVAEGHWSWCGSRFPAKLPLPRSRAAVARTSEIALAYNYCTLCYTMAYRGESFWREEIDRLALYGFNRARELLPSIRTNAAARAEFLTGILEMDRVLSASPYFRMDHYEKLAAELDPEHGPAAVKRMYTTWVEPSGVHGTLDDYAHRQLSGLMDYYYGRWTDFLYRQER